MQVKEECIKDVKEEKCERCGSKNVYKSIRINVVATRGFICCEDCKHEKNID